MKVALVDEGHGDGGLGQGFGGIEAAETAAHDHHPM
jgi:hypothetical protein